VNRIFSRRDERLRAVANARDIIVKSVRPDQPEPIPVRTWQHRMGKIILRFVVLLVIGAGLLMLAWRR
jgi:hypothetical protein